MTNERSMQRQSELTRRVVLRSAAITGVAVPFLAACGSDEPADSPEAEAEATAEVSGGESLASTSDVPVGEGTVLKDEKIVLTQPTEGDFKAFTAVCTHKGCTVDSVTDGIIKCPCHGSMFSARDGSVQGGPAPAPLEEIPIKVDGDQIVLA